MGFMVVPQPDIVAVGVEDDRTLTIFFFQPVGIQSGLNSSLLGIDAGFFCFHHRQRFMRLIPQDIIRITVTGCSRLFFNGVFLRNLIGIIKLFPYIPVGGKQARINQAATGFRFINREDICNMLVASSGFIQALSQVFGLSCSCCSARCSASSRSRLSS